MTMGYALAQTGAYDASIMAYERASALHGPYALDAYTSIGVIRLQQEQSEPAAAAFRAALELDTAGARRDDLLRRLRIAEARGRGLDGGHTPPSSP
jgi:tetratricopeptide (TPR) repeat protein